MIPDSYDEECLAPDLPQVDEEFYSFGGSDVWLYTLDEAEELRNFLNAKRFLHRSFPTTLLYTGPGLVTSKSPSLGRVYESTDLDCSAFWCTRGVGPVNAERRWVVAYCFHSSSRPNLVLRLKEGKEWQEMPYSRGVPFLDRSTELDVGINHYSNFPCKLFTLVNYTHDFYFSYSTRPPGDQSRGGPFRGLLANGVCKVSKPGKGTTRRKP